MRQYYCQEHCQILSVSIEIWALLSKAKSRTLVSSNLIQVYPCRDASGRIFQEDKSYRYAREPNAVLLTSWMMNRRWFTCSSALHNSLSFQKNRFYQLDILRNATLNSALVDSSTFNAQSFGLLLDKKFHFYCYNWLRFQRRSLNGIRWSR